MHFIWTLPPALWLGTARILFQSRTHGLGHTFGHSLRLSGSARLGSFSFRNTILNTIRAGASHHPSRAGEEDHPYETHVFTYTGCTELKEQPSTAANVSACFLMPRSCNASRLRWVDCLIMISCVLSTSAEGYAPRGVPHRVQGNVDAAESPSDGLMPQTHLHSFRFAPSCCTSHDTVSWSRILGLGHKICKSCNAE